MQNSIFFTCLTLALSFTCSLKLSAQSDSPRIHLDKDSAKIFTKVDKPAEFPGGADGWRAFLEANLRYPKKAVKKEITGVVRVQFIVDKEGFVREVVSLNDPGGGLAEEAIRVIAKTKWIPAEQNGRKVIYRHIQAITFMLE